MEFKPCLCMGGKVQCADAPNRAQKFFKPLGLNSKSDWSGDGRAWISATGKANAALGEASLEVVWCQSMRPKVSYEGIASPNARDLVWA